MRKVTGTYFGTLFDERITREGNSHIPVRRTVTETALFLTLDFIVFLSGRNKKKSPPSEEGGL